MKESCGYAIKSAASAIRRCLRMCSWRGICIRFHDYNRGTECYEYEQVLSKIESNAKPAISSVIEQVRGQRNPRLVLELDRRLKEFVIAMARRTPESQERVFGESDRSFEEVFDSVVKDLLKGAGYDVPEQDWFDRDPSVLKLKQTMKANHSANFAAGEHHILREESESFSRETGWSFALIELPKRSFVIGSHGLTVMQEGAALGDNWLPIAHDVAIQVTGFPDRGFRLCLDDKNESIIKSINKATAAQSDIVVGRSEALIGSLMGKIDETRLNSEDVQIKKMARCTALLSPRETIQRRKMATALSG